ncbi:MAG: pilus assembly protein [Alphaproteobacteria bacterium]|nr:MAG: pilus assembly protein [Alphaproteobacteria bacterium]
MSGEVAMVKACDTGQIERRQRTPWWRAVKARVARCARRVGEPFGRLAGDERGASLVYFGAVFLPLFAVTGLAVDASRAYIVRAQLQKSIDAAGLAAGRVAYTDHAVDDARAYFDANFPDGFMGATVTAFNVEFDDSKENVDVTVSATMPTTFMQVFGKDTMSVSSATTIHRDNQGMELALVLDVTGSMFSGNHIAGLRDATRELIEILFGDETENDYLWVSMVPYTATVNIGGHRTNWLVAGDPAVSSPSNWAPSVWKGCVMARPTPVDADDTPPPVVAGGIGFESYFYAAGTDNAWDNGSNPPDETWQSRNNARGPNLGCGPEIVSLTNQKQTLLDAVDDLNPWSRGGTTGNLGLSWGWRTISPRWRGLWGGHTPSIYPLAYDEPQMQKVVIVLTDGQNQFYDWPGKYTWNGETPPNGNGPDGSDFTAYDRLDNFADAHGESWSLSEARDELDSRMADTCAAMKAEGIIIYSITFGSPDSKARDLFRACATSSAHYFNSPDNETLAQHFKTIGQQLSKLRVAK